MTTISEFARSRDADGGLSYETIEQLLSDVREDPIFNGWYSVLIELVAGYNAYEYEYGTENRDAPNNLETTQGE